MGVNVHFSNPSTVSQPLNDFLLSLITMRIEEMSPLDCMTKLYEIKRTAGNLREALTTPPEPDTVEPDDAQGLSRILGADGLVHRLTSDGTAMCGYTHFTAFSTHGHSMCKECLRRELMAESGGDILEPELPVGYMRPCEACDGTGTESNGDYVRPCSYCDGTGIHDDDAPDPQPEPPATDDDIWTPAKHNAAILSRIEQIKRNNPFSIDDMNRIASLQDDLIEPEPPATRPEYASIESELAAQGLRRADIGAGEPGWYVTTSFGQVWATDAPAPEPPAAPDPKPQATIKLSKAQRELLQALADGVEIKHGWQSRVFRVNGHSISQRTLDYCTELARQWIKFEEIDINERRYTAIRITELGRAALKGAK